ncbi:hypothetical protein [Streptomyces sp. TP-A0875]|uniref:hypothetical protein n=1 Tax=Streptomyces sp. TP-A0875 TaxID=552354 RepID=UPI000AEF03B0|nr:hypothetical protein [Streptomyces sp. TP-A0875]
MIPAAAQALIHSAVWDAGQHTDPRAADRTAQAVIQALADDGWMITADRTDNGPQSAA